eukprot:TRINITY_DN27403_c0_g1_i1.p1 TRINITY_DN27403_c0_g1~~TRINITY_DN27403_c0_g1_i1.p1  ORF type:complete len:307 (+),score=22.26 TRINITY_DN27403_c0_g1_i1:113-922(+)
MVSGSLSEDVRLFLLSSLPQDEASLKSMGFEMHNDHPSCPGHNYFEGYFHAVPNSDRTTVDSIHPRLGDAMKRQPAPPALFKFCDAFRKANAGLFENLREDLAKHRNSACLARVLESGRHFADISVQIHWGEAVKAPDIAWHIDAPNSYLHMAIGLSGSRALHARRQFRNGRVSRHCLVGSTDEREVVWQSEGDLYLGTPCCYPHAVEYPECAWDNRIVAVQLRLLLTEEELFGSIDVDVEAHTARTVFRHLASQSELVIPTLEELKAD